MWSYVRHGSVSSAQHLNRLVEIQRLKCNSSAMEVIDVEHRDEAQIKVVLAIWGICMFISALSEIIGLINAGYTKVVMDIQ